MNSLHPTTCIFILVLNSESIYSIITHASASLAYLKPCAFIIYLVILLVEILSCFVARAAEVGFIEVPKVILVFLEALYRRKI